MVGSIGSAVFCVYLIVSGINIEKPPENSGYLFFGINFKSELALFLF